MVVQREGLIIILTQIILVLTFIDQSLGAATLSWGYWIFSFAYFTSREPQQQLSRRHRIQLSRIWRTCCRIAILRSIDFPSPWPSYPPVPSSWLQQQAATAEKQACGGWWLVGRGARCKVAFHAGGLFLSGPNLGATSADSHWLDLGPANGNTETRNVRRTRIAPSVNNSKT